MPSSYTGAPPPGTPSLPAALTPGRRSGQTVFSTSPSRELRLDGLKVASQGEAATYRAWMVLSQIKAFREAMAGASAFESYPELAQLRDEVAEFSRGFPTTGF